ncbi:hypothetical protein KIPB_006297 [Kipferlia bialata]|uniref:Uncharacterized protein n=1 Tax=Kipferlia bialata TaxID=797122 RepID=A0A9K3GJQ7_9EUKA|nr:hypothetical protein KIPB_006297 [Kipferlia bialata]|eukprot:g6297.t1
MRRYLAERKPVAISGVAVLDDGTSATLEGVFRTYPRERFSTTEGCAQYAHDVLRGVVTLASLPANRARLLTPAMEEVYKWVHGLCKDTVVVPLFLRLLRYLTEDVSLLVTAANSIIVRTTLPTLECFPTPSNLTDALLGDVSYVLFHVCRRSAAESLKKMNESMIERMTGPVYVADNYQRLIPRMIASRPITRNIMALLAGPYGMGEADITPAHIGMWGIMDTVLDAHSTDPAILLSLTQLYVVPSYYGTPDDAPGLTVAPKYLAALAGVVADGGFCRDFFSILHAFMKEMNDLPPRLPTGWDCTELISVCIRMMDLHKTDRVVSGMGAAVIARLLYGFRSNPETVVSVINAVFDAYDRYPEDKCAGEGLVLLGGCVCRANTRHSEGEEEVRAFSGACIAAASPILAKRGYHRLAILAMNRHPKSFSIQYFAWDAFCHYAIHCGIGQSYINRTQEWMDLVPAGLVETLLNLVVFAPRMPSDHRTHCTAFIVRTLCYVFDHDETAKARVTRAHTEAARSMFSNSHEWLDGYDGMAPWVNKFKDYMTSIILTHLESR